MLTSSRINFKSLHYSQIAFRDKSFIVNPEMIIINVITSFFQGKPVMNTG